MYARPVNAAPPTPQSFTHEQNIAAAVWTMSHGLGRAVAVSVLNTAGEEVEGRVVHVDLNSVRVEFNVPLAGRAIVS